MALLLNVFIKSLFRCRQFLLNFINELMTENISALLQKTLSDYTKYAQLQRIARILKLSLLVESRFNSTLQKVNNKGADQIIRLRRCGGCSVPLLYTCIKVRFSKDKLL